MSGCRGVAGGPGKARLGGAEPLRFVPETHYRLKTNRDRSFHPASLPLSH